MKRIILASPKGGAGKTTLCRNLAATAAAEGLRVAVGDLDPQRTLTKWWRRRRPGERPIAHYELSMQDADTVADDDAVEPCDVFLVDTPPAMEAYPAALQKLLGATDFILVPSRPTLDDAESAVPFMQVLRRRKRPAAFVINAVKPRANILGVKSLLLRAGEVCPVEISDRMDYSRGAEHGVGVADLGDHPGAREMAGVWEFLRSKVWGFANVSA